MSIKLSAPLCLILIGTLATSGCKRKQEQFTNPDLVQEIIKDGIPSGTIGRLNLIEIPTSENPEVNLIQILNHKKKEVQAQGTGTRVRDQKNKQDYILTVAHFFNFDLKEYKHQDFALYVGKNGKFNDGGWYRISPEIYSMINPLENDKILIPVDYDEGANAYDIGGFLSEQTTTLPANISIVSLLNLKNTKKFRKIKQSAKLLDKGKLRSDFWKTNADLFLGMSGSPVFNENNKIVGIVSRITRLKSCSEYSPLACHNLIAPIAPNWIEDHREEIDTKKLFVRVVE